MTDAVVASAGAVPPAGRRRRPPGLGRHAFGLAMQAPSLVLLAVVVAVPLVFSLVLSFQRYSPVLPGAEGQWVGVENYARLLGDAQFGRAVLVTLAFTALAVALETILGTGLGIYLTGLAATRRFVTSLLLLPMIATPLVVGLMFGFALNADFGYLSPILHAVGIAPAGGVLADPVTAFLALVLTDVWEWVPFIALIVMAGLASIPDEPVEAARIDGANAWQLQWHVRLPMIRGVLAVAILFRATEAIREFDKVFVLTGGGPGSATTVNDLYQYRTAFGTWDLSYGATLGMVSFAAILLISAITFRALSGTRGGER